MTELKIEGESVERWLRKRSPSCADLRGKMIRGEISREEVYTQLAFWDADELIDAPMQVHPYPVALCRELSRVRSLPPDEMRRVIERKDCDWTMYEIGKKQHGAWYALVCSDLGHLEATIRRVGPGTTPGRQLVHQLKRLAFQYGQVTDLPWPRDRALPDGVPCKTPEFYLHLANRHMAAVR